MLENWSDLIEVFTQPLITTLPLTLLFLLIGARYAGWRSGECFLPFAPWVATMLAIAHGYDERYFPLGMTVGIIGGFTLLPRLIIRTKDPWSMMATSIISSIITTVLALMFFYNSGPAYRY